MEEYGLELLNERKGDVFSIVNEIFEFGSFLKGDDQEMVIKRISKKI